VGDGDRGTIEAFYAAFNEGDVDAMVALLAPDPVVEEAPGFNPSAGVYRGLEEVRGYLEGWFKFWESVKVEVGGITELESGPYVAEVRVTVSGRRSDIEFADTWAHVVELREGLIAHAVLHRSTKDALEAVRARAEGPGAEGRQRSFRR
jgi:ketosteroid isomerase-like protein